MIPVTRSDGSSVLVNPDRIELVEETPDTVITFADGKKLLVRETAALVAERFRLYHRSLRQGEVQFGGRRRSDPPADMNPEAYEHPNRGAIRTAPRLISNKG